MSVIRKFLIFITVIAMILLLLYLSAVAPYFFACIQNETKSMLRVDTTKIDIPIINYIQSLSAVLSFLTTTAISLLVFFTNSSKIKKEKKQAAFNVYTYFNFSIKSIECYHENINGNLQISEFVNCIYQNLFIIGLSKSDIDILSQCHLEIQKIKYAAEMKQDNIDNLCKRFCEGSDCQKLKNILVHIFNKYFK